MLKKFGKKVKDFFTSNAAGVATGVVGGHALSSFLIELFKGGAGEVGKLVLQNITQTPPRAELEKVLLGLPDPKRIFWEERLKEAKDDTNHRPSENETVTAWCKPLLLKKMKVYIQNKDGGPALDKEGHPAYYETGEILNDDELREHIYGKVADLGVEEFWIWTDLLIHDRWQQIFQRFGKKFQNLLKANWQKIVNLYKKVMTYTENESNRAHQEVRAQRDARRRRIENITNN